jgi:hypothetical protein
VVGWQDASEQCVPCTLEDVIAQGMWHASGVKAKEEAAFDVPPDAKESWRRVPVTEREAAWMRVELPKIMDDCTRSCTELPPAMKGKHNLMLEYPTSVRRGGEGLAASLRARPNIYNYIVNERSVHVVNFATKKNMLFLKEHGINSVPCGNPYCLAGCEGEWRTTPIAYSHATGAPNILVDAKGMSNALVTMRSKCDDCSATFRHTDAVVLHRLRDVPEVLATLPFDPEWGFDDIFLSASVTCNAEYDVTSRQGIANMVEKLAKCGEKEVVRMMELYLCDARMWMEQMGKLVGDAAWALLTEAQKMELAPVRGEYAFFSSTPEPATPLGEGHGCADARRFNIPILTAKTITKQLLENFEQQRSLDEAIMYSVGCGDVCSLDCSAPNGPPTSSTTTRTSSPRAPPTRPPLRRSSRCSRRCVCDPTSVRASA